MLPQYWNSGLDVGMLGLLAVCLWAAFLAYRNKAARRFLAVAMLLRIGAVLTNHFLLPLPDSSPDAITFERLAWEWASSSDGFAVEYFPGMHSYFYSWVLSLLYTMTERSPLLLEATSVLMGITCVHTGYGLSLRLFGTKAAMFTGWALALSPPLILYSSLVVRESAIVLLLLIAANGIVQWFEKHRFQGILTALGAFYFAAYFHGAMLIGGLLFASLLIIRLSYHFLIRRREHRALSVLILVSGVTALAITLSTNPYIPKLGHLQSAASASSIREMIEDRHLKSVRAELRTADGGATYPQWTIPESDAALLWVVPARTVYFALTPFPWEVKTPRQVIGLVDTTIYMAIYVLILLNVRALWARPDTRSLLLILALYAVAFGIGTSNFGAAIRHRAKFQALLLVLASPMAVIAIESMRQSIGRRRRQHTFT